MNNETWTVFIERCAERTGEGRFLQYTAPREKLKHHIVEWVQQSHFSDEKDQVYSKIDIYDNEIIHDDLTPWLSGEWTPFVDGGGDFTWNILPPEEHNE